MNAYKHTHVFISLLVVCSSCCLSLSKRDIVSKRKSVCIIAIASEEEKKSIASVCVYACMCVPEDQEKKNLHRNIFLSLSIYLSECKNEATNYISTSNQNNGKNKSKNI